MSRLALAFNADLIPNRFSLGRLEDRLHCGFAPRGDPFDKIYKTLSLKLGADLPSSPMGCVISSKNHLFWLWRRFPSQ